MWELLPNTAARWGRWRSWRQDGSRGRSAVGCRARTCDHQTEAHQPVENENWTKNKKRRKKQNVGDMKQQQPHCRSSWLQPSLCFSPPQSPCHGIAIKEIYMVLGSGGDFEIYLLKITDKAGRRSIVWVAHYLIKNYRLKAKLLFWAPKAVIFTGIPF